MKNKQKILYMAAALLPMLLVLLFYPTLPEQVPTRFNMGQIAAYGPKSTLLLLGCIPILIAVLFPLLKKFDPKKENYRYFESIFYQFAIIINFFLLLMLAVCILEAKAPGRIRVENIIFASLGFLFAFMGNFLPKIKQNFGLGLRTRWTLSSEENWQKTHRFAGKIYFFCGILLLVTGLLPLSQWTLYLPAIAILLIIILAPVSYSFWEYQRSQRL